MLLDVNLLLYAYDAASPHHRRTRTWMEGALSRHEPLALAWATIVAFLRISTHARAPKPVSLAEATEVMAQWLAHPSVSILHPTERHWDILRDVLAAAQARGALVTDAHLAALAIEHGATLCTNDRDFTRFRGLRTFNPFETA